MDHCQGLWKARAAGMRSRPGSEEWHWIGFLILTNLHGGGHRAGPSVQQKPQKNDLFLYRTDLRLRASVPLGIHRI